MANNNTPKIEDILETSYYDLRADHIWKDLVERVSTFPKHLHPIENLEWFEAVYTMLNKRYRSIPTFMKEWEKAKYPGLLSCKYNEQTGILKLKARTFAFTYQSALNTYLIEVPHKLAKCIGLQRRVLKKTYRKGGLFKLSLLSELDEQLFTRYESWSQLQEWYESPQRELDLEYCSTMIPYIMQHYDEWSESLSIYQKLNIILHGSDTVRIGIGEEYSPEEMKSMSCYPREEWQRGIDETLDDLTRKHAAEMKRRTEERLQWCEELKQIALREPTSFNIEACRHKYSTIDKEDDFTAEILESVTSYSDAKREKDIVEMLDLFSLMWNGVRVNAHERMHFSCFSCEVDDACAKIMFMLNEEIAQALHYKTVSYLSLPPNPLINKKIIAQANGELSKKYDEYLNNERRKQQPQYALLKEAVRCIVEQTAPLSAYIGRNALLMESYSVKLAISDDDQITVKTNFMEQSYKRVFELENLQSQFRAWWSQLLLKECKYAKDCALHPEWDYIDKTEELPF